jgi:hypothetical protein
MLDMSLDEMAWLATDAIAGLLVLLAVTVWWRWR